MPIQTKDLTRDAVKYGLIAAAGALVTTAVLSQTTRQRTDEAKFERRQRKGAISVREYAPAIAAQVEINGMRGEAIKRGFHLLAAYIFGENLGAEKITMTAPVLQLDSDQNEMVAPATHHGAGTKWTIQFIMPEHYTLDTLPQPTNPLVAIREVPERQMAVIRFSGSSSNSLRIAEKILELEAYLDEKGLKPTSNAVPVLAFYDPPWTLPFLRRNEVMIELQTAEKAAPKPETAAQTEVPPAKLVKNR